MGYVHNAWYVASWAHQLETGKPFAARILNESIVLYRTTSGRAVALQDRCSHRLAPLSLGRCEGESIRCMYHGLRFGPDGACNEIPGQELIPPAARVRSYPVVERYDWIWIWMGDERAVDEGLIPSINGPDDGPYLLGKGVLDYEARADLIWDNLLDFSHLGYVHATSFNTTETWGETRAEFTALSHGVRADRWVLDQPPLFGDQRSDQWFTYDLLVPGILILKAVTYPIGKAAQFGFKAPPDDEAWIQHNYSVQAITPMTDGTARYFFTFGPHTEGASEELRDKMLEIISAAFLEDRAVIEAQSRVMAENPDVRVMPTSGDRGITLFHRITDRLIRTEDEVKMASAIA